MHPCKAFREGTWLRKWLLAMAHADGLFLRSSLEVGRACKSLAQIAMTAGVIFASALKEPKVMNPDSAAGSSPTGGASCAGV